MVPLPLRYIKKLFGSISQKRLQSNFCLCRLHSQPTVALGIARSPLEITLSHQAFDFYKQTFRLPADNFPLQRLASSPTQARLKKRPSCRSFCSFQETHAPRETLILCSHVLSWAFQTSLWPLLLKAAPSPTQVDLTLCSRLSQKTPRVRCSRMDWWLCPFPFGCRRCRFSCDMQKMFILFFSVLLNWPNLL